MKKANLLKTLLVAAGLLVGASAWAYDVPEGMEVKNVFAGTDNGDGTVSVETFETMTTLTNWTKDGIKPVNSVTLGEVEEVANTTVGGTLDSDVVPTYVGGKVMHAYLRQGTNTGNCYASFPFDAVSTGKLVFNADFWMSGNANSPILIKFVDKDDNTLLEMNWNNGSGVRAFNYTNLKDDETFENKATSNLCEYRKYKGFGVRDLVVDFATGEVTFKIDYIDRNAKRSQTSLTTNIGTGKNIASVQVGKAALSSTDLYIDVDNMSLYTIGTASSSFNYTIKAMAGETELATLASGACKTDMTYSVSGLSKVIKKDGKFYMLDDVTVNGYAKTFTMGDADEEQTINYTEDASIVYFGEVENMANAVYPVEGSFSGGIVAAINGSKVASLTTLNAGIYKVSGYVNDHAFRGLVLRTENSSAEDKLLSYITSATNNIMSGNFVISADETPVCLSGITQNNGKLNQSADLDYVLIQKIGEINTMSIVGDFSANGWEAENGIAMTQDTENPAIWTAVVKDFIVTSAKFDYQYKAVANGNWSDWVIGNDNASNDDKNQEYGFNYDGAGEGKYTLTFTANTRAKTVELSIEKQPTATIYFINTGDWAADNIKAWVWDANNSDYNYTGGNWPGQTMTATGEQIDGKDVYSWSTYVLNPTPTTLIISNNGSDTERTGDQPFVNGATYRPDGGIASVTKTITAAGYATFCSANALDFSSTGLTAYIAKKDASNNVTFTPVTKVPANTGVLLKGDAGNYTISTTSDATDDVTDNVLVGVTIDTPVPAGSFVLMNGEKGVGFYKANNAFTVGANTAYIAALSEYEARSFIGFNFDGTTTAIEGVATVKENNGEIYNLQGQRVLNAQKGLYIVNGKKVFIK